MEHMGQSNKRKKNIILNKKTEKNIYIQKAEAVIFYILLILFMLERLPESLNLTGIYIIRMELVLHNLRSIIVWGCVIYIIFRLILYRKNIIITGLAVAGAILLYYFRYDIMHTELRRCAFISLLLVIAGYGRNYRTILKIYLIAHIAIMILGLIGIPLGITTSCGKIETNAGTSLGMVYPNQWGGAYFLVIVTAWYLWFKDRPFITALICIISAVPIQIYIRCTTVAMMLAVFPLCSIMMWIIERRQRNVTELSDEKQAGAEVLLIPNRAGHCIARAVAVSFPVMCLIITAVLGTMREAIYMLTDRTEFSSIAMRFITAGILFANFPVNLFGYDMNMYPVPVEVYGSYEYSASIVDNSYVYYLLMLGAVWMAVYLAWLSYTGYRSVAAGDMYMFWIILFMTGYGLIELTPFEFEHNYIYFYPLALGNSVYLKKLLSR